MSWMRELEGGGQRAIGDRGGSDEVVIAVALTLLALNALRLQRATRQGPQCRACDLAA